MYFIPSPIIQKLPQKDEYYYGSIHHIYPYKLREAENICLLSTLLMASLRPL